jgi:hypothetical protein
VTLEVPVNVASNQIFVMYFSQPFDLLQKVPSDLRKLRKSHGDMSELVSLPLHAWIGPA